MSPTERVEEQLTILGELNELCWPRLHDLLRENHQIHVFADAVNSEGHRGTAIYAAYDPWNTCLRVVPGSAKYFAAAQRLGLVNHEDSLKISLALIRCCNRLKARYKGRFSYFYNLQQVSALLACCDDHSVRYHEAVKAPSADLLYGCVPWPVRPMHHLIARTLREISFARSASSDPFSATADAIEFASWGPWIGFSARDVIEILAELQAPGMVNKQPLRGDLRIKGRRIILPFFSSGFQGIVVGFFIGIDDDVTTEHIRTELLQYGQTLADKWSMLRCQLFSEALTKSRSPEYVAEALVHMVSPVEQVVLRTGEQSFVYKLQYENGDWGGYEKFSSRHFGEAIGKRSDIQFEWGGTTISIKTLSGCSMLDPVFTRARLEMIIKHAISTSPKMEVYPRLTLQILQEIHDLIQQKIESGSPSLATLRQDYVVRKVMTNLSAGKVSVSNNEMRTHLKRQNPAGANHGFQVSSHADEIRKLLPQMVTLSKSRKGITLYWPV